MKEATFFIRGMTCASCSSGVSKSLLRLKGVVSAEVNLVSTDAHVIYDEKLIGLESIFDFINKMGYSVAFEEGRDEGVTIVSLMSAVILMVAVLYFGMLTHMGAPGLSPKLNYTIELFATLMIMIIGRQFFTSGFRKLFAFHPNMDSLIALGASFSFIWSVILYFLILSDGVHRTLYFESASVIIAFVMLGKYIEVLAKRQSESESGIEGLLSDSALKLDDGSFVLTPSASVVVGDILKVRAHEVVPVDGVVKEGSAMIDTSNINGESALAFKSVGDRIQSGYVLESGELIMEASAKLQDSMISQILKTSYRARNSRPKIAKIVDIISSYFTFTILAIASLAFLFWLFYRDLPFALNIFITIVVVSCPCALGLATPLAILFASIKSDRLKVLFKDADALESLSKVQTAIFDKTGTLTESRLEISKTHILGDITLESALALACALEKNNEHAIASAFVNSQGSGDTRGAAEDITESIGQGISGSIDGVRYYLGKLSFVMDAPISEEVLKEGIRGSVKEALKSPSIVIFLSRQGEGGRELLAAFEIESPIKKGALDLISFLKSRGIKSVMLSGDRDSLVRDVARKIGMDVGIGDLTPQDKLDFIEKEKQSRRVMMVGDGLNDAPALALSDVAVVMNSGSSFSKEKGDIVILTNQITSLMDIFKLSLAARRNISYSLFFAFIYNVVAVLFATGALYSFGLVLNPMIGAIAMSASSIIVVLNAQRLRF